MGIAAHVPAISGYKRPGAGPKTKSPIAMGSGDKSTHPRRGSRSIATGRNLTGSETICPANLFLGGYRTTSTGTLNAHVRIMTSRWLNRAKKRFLQNCVLASSLSAFSALAESPDGLSAWGAAGLASTDHRGAAHSGLLLAGGLSLPAPPEDRQSIRFSISHLFDDSPIDRYNLLAHFGYRATERFGAGLLGGVEYLEMKSSARAFLKPLVGFEVNFLIVTGTERTISTFAACEFAQGSTGTLAFNGGDDGQSARILTIGLAVSIKVFD